MRADEWPSSATQSFMSTEKKSAALGSGAPPAKTTRTSRLVPEKKNITSKADFYPSPNAEPLPLFPHLKEIVTERQRSHVCMFLPFVLSFCTVCFSFTYVRKWALACLCCWALHLKKKKKILCSIFHDVSVDRANAGQVGFISVEKQIPPWSWKHLPEEPSWFWSHHIDTSAADNFQPFYMQLARINWNLSVWMCGIWKSIHMLNYMSVTWERLIDSFVVVVFASYE